LSDYRNLTYRLIDGGLNLRDAPDLVGQAKWVRLANVGTPQEGGISQRAGTDLIATTDPTTPLHSIRRLDADTLILGHGARLSTQAATLVLSGLSGNILSIIPFKPIGASEAWAYIGDSARMLKVNADGSVFQWGIDAPTGGTTLVIDGSGGLDTTVADAAVYDWIVTYASSRTGAESNGSPASTFSASGSAFAVLVSAAPSTDPQVDEIRFYRRGGVLFDEYRLSGTAVNNPALATITYRDARADSEIVLAELLPTTKFRPFPSVDANGVTAYGVHVPYLDGPGFGRYIFGVGDVLRPGYVYWTNPEDPDTADVTNNVQVTAPTEPLIGIKIFNGIPYTISRDNLYAIDPGVAANSFVGRKTTFGRGTVSPSGWCVGPVLFVCSNDGIYKTTGEDPGMSITEDSLRPLFHGYAVEDYAPIDFTASQFIRLYWAGQDLHFLYRDTDGGRQHLVWSSIYERWQASVESAITDIAVYADENSPEGAVFFGGLDGSLYQRNVNAFADGGNSFVATARTGFTDFGMPQTFKEIGNIILDADPAGLTITITPILNNDPTQTLTPFTVTGNGRQKFSFPFDDIYVHSIAFQFSWTSQASVRPRIFQFDLLWRPDEEGIKHWEFPATSHGLSGWQSLRDGYITVRSVAELTMTVMIDGQKVAPLTFRGSSNTSGDRRKLYFDAPPLKGKIFQYEIDSPEDFRLYGEDCELRLKSWNTNLGYQLVSPFVKEG
jgi:hypothetical protein